MIIPMLCVGMNPVTLCVTVDAERPWLHSHAERGNDH
jgi:ureidoglycolate lyase